MSENQIQEIADNADMIVNSYAFTRKNDTISILNLRRPECAMVISEDGKLLETMHAHASDTKLIEAASAKFFIKADGSTEVQKRGTLKEHEITKIQRFIKEHYLEMYQTWREDSENGFYQGK